MRIAFDLDGTLITAKERQSLLLKSIAARYGVHISPDEVWAAKREGDSNLLVLGKLGVQGELSEKIDLAWRYEIESPYWLDMDRLFWDARYCLCRLAATPCELYLITARKNEWLLRYQINKLDIAKLFNRVVSVNPFDATNEKAKILKEIKPSCFVGDSETDLKASSAADVKFCGVTTGQRSRRFLISLGALNISESLTEVLAKIVT
jgi:phosphoglycolate phosphatase-like HAD superfamily hydrolase